MKGFELLKVGIHAAGCACKEILEIYHSENFNTELKADRSPLTMADKRAHSTILSALAEANIPVLSEEGKDVPYELRRNWEYLWLVDPLDGTKEFLKRNGEFTVNIALIHNQRPVLGVVAVPVSGDVYYAAEGNGAFVKRNGKAIQLPKRSPVNLMQPGIRVVASRSHLNDETKAFIDSLNNPTLVSKGSSLKFMLLAEGIADVYPRFAPTMEWDTAAAHTIVREVGLCVLQRDAETELVYNKPDLINPHFISA
ncbi:MAG: 3'(2'),5'-bisphosphate nucleotidase CysQ [Flammeovirgaceae bacterium]|nr:MAG: 3'(2'),5'-bisphosphate nucleotidase CysQ [Flammeovirgaceae bacterium]